ncbi:MAG: phenylacetate--CoA ligase family protein, partial [Kiritimatiellia bacterium]
AFGYGLFTGGFGLHYGVEKVGAAIVPVAAGNTQRQIMLLEDLRADVLICTPSYALNLAEAAAAQGTDPRSLALRFGHFGAEPWTEDMRCRIELAFGLHAFNNYGLSEVTGPGVSGECCRRNGMHIQEDHFLVECLDPDTLEPVRPGTPGELVITTLTKQAMPLLRYRTRDITTLDDSPCACGRTGMRMARVIGRSDDMLIVRGVNVFPSQIEEALLRVDGTAPHYQIEVDRPGALDEMTIRVEMRPEKFTDSFAALEQLRRDISRTVSSIAGLHAKIELVKPQTLERFEGKARRVFDRRREPGRGP